MLPPIRSISTAKQLALNPLKGKDGIENLGLKAPVYAYCGSEEFIDLVNEKNGTASAIAVSESAWIRCTSLSSI